MPVLEAMARGVPVVTSDIPALRETGGDAAVYFDPDDENEIAASVVRLLDSARLRNEYAERGIERASCFSWYESARRTRRVYQEAVEEHAR